MTVDEIVDKLNSIVDDLKSDILSDIEDVKKANHERLLDRNTKKEEALEDIVKYKALLNEQLSKEFQEGIDISIYKNKVDSLELNLRELYELNGRLGSIVLPVKQMYKDIIDDIVAQNGGSLVEVMA